MARDSNIGDFAIDFQISGITGRGNRATSWQIVARLDSLKRVLYKPPIGKVVVSGRKKLRGEKTKAIHGKGIANILKKKRGIDPFSYPSSVESRVYARMKRLVLSAMEDVFRGGDLNANRAKIRLSVIEAAEILAGWSQAFIVTGGMGDKKIPEPVRAPGESDEQFKIRKRRKRDTFFRGLDRLVKRGLATKKYGWPPPYGVLSGRFVEGIRALPKRTGSVRGASGGTSRRVTSRALRGRAFLGDRGQ